MTLWQKTEIAIEMAENGSAAPAQELLEMCQKALDAQMDSVEDIELIAGCAIELELALADFEPQHPAPDWDSMVRFDEFTR